MSRKLLYCILYGMRRRYSHLDRVNRRKEKQKVYIYLGLLVFLIGFFAIFGIQLLSRISIILTQTSSPYKKEQNDRLVLVAPRLDPLDEATNSATITISGYANEGETVAISTETDIVKVFVGKDGTFSAPDIELVEGENRISAKVTKDKKESPSSNLVSIVYKKTPPKLDVSEPEDGKEYVGDQKEATIKGVTEGDIKITVNDRFVRVENDGSFTTTYSLPEGETTLTIKATDIAGNETKIERKVKYRP